jgi:phenylpropionate dioxygenase-like ring-hydroxylating dioxygenase large terminal subunit
MPAGHRGMQVASDTGCTRAFVCRYHGWTYNLEGRPAPHPARGRLSRLRQGSPSAGADDGERALRLVFVTQDEPALATIRWAASTG